MKQVTVKIAKGFSEAQSLFKASTAEERLDEVERLRLEAGKFMYEYPTRLQRVLTAVRKI